MQILACVATFKSKICLTNTMKCCSNSSLTGHSCREGDSLISKHHDNLERSTALINRAKITTVLHYNSWVILFRRQWCKGLGQTEIEIRARGLQVYLCPFILFFSSFYVNKHLYYLYFNRHVLPVNHLWHYSFFIFYFYFSYSLGMCICFCCVYPF